VGGSKGWSATAVATVRDSGLAHGGGEGGRDGGREGGRGTD